MAFSIIVALCALLFGAVFPAAIIIVRGTVKQQRQQVITDLARVLHPPGTAIVDGEQDALLNALEFVKYKYFVQDASSAGRRRRDVPVYAWAVALLPFLLVVSSVTMMSVGSLLQAASPRLAPAWWSEHVSPITIGTKYWLWAITGAFLGSYAQSLSQLFQAISNFYLRPASFIEAAIDMVTGIGVAGLLAVAAPIGIYSVGALTQTVSLAGVLLTSYMLGAVPNLALRTITRRVGLRSFKREDDSVFDAFTAVPLEIIDGIDTGISGRLADYHIATVQNLAAANPIMLFVETPYGVFQIIDWVAQAQLCASVGPRAVIALWNLGVRTLFDLERLALDPACHSPALLQAVGRALFLKVAASQSAEQAAAEFAAHLEPREIVAAILLRLNDSHVHRLRQIVNQVGKGLGAENQRLLFARTLPACALERAHC